MKIPEEVKQYFKYGEDYVDYPPNAEKMIQIMNQMIELRIKADRLYVTLSYHNLAEILLGDVDLSSYKEKADNIYNELYRLNGKVENEIPENEGNFGEFYHAIQMGLDYNSNSVDLINNLVDALRNIIETGDDNPIFGDGLKKANDNSMINEFKRFT